MKTFVLTIGTLALFAGLFIYNALTWGFICYKFWGWFILPVFTTLPIITFVQAIGLIYFISLFKNIPKHTNKTEGTNWEEITMLVLIPWLLLFFGWLVKSIFLI